MKKQNNLLSKYMDMCTDHAFKIYFGPGVGKPNLINFLNCLFQGEKDIKDIDYLSIEEPGEQASYRKVLFDLLCTSDDNSQFIIEMQCLLQDFYKDGSVYYTAKRINKLIPKGFKGNTYELPEVYFIGILDFVMKDTTDDQYYYDVALIDKQSQKQFYHKLGFKYVMLPNFNKKPAELKSPMDEWLYLFKHITELEEMPKFLDKRIFQLMFPLIKTLEG